MLWRPWLTGAFVALAAIALGACSVVLDLREVDYGLTEDGGSTTDAPLPDGDAGSPKVEPSPEAVDAGTADASAVESTSICTAQPGARFCRQFDDGKPFELGFTTTKATGGTLALDTTDGFSKPGSLLARTTGADGCAYASRADGNSFETVGMVFRVRVGPDTTGTLARILLGPCEFGLTTGFAYQRKSGSTAVVASQPFPAQVPAATWVKVRLDVAEEGVLQPRIRVAIDDVQVVNTLLSANQCPFFAGAATFTIGLLCGEAGRELRYDDVIFYE